MGLFYVWIKRVQNNWFDQELAVFVDREAADEWWRRISTPPSPYAKCITRLSPQFYVANDGHSVYWHYQNDTQPPEIRHSFQGMIIESSNITILPIASFTDHISGRWYFIRSKADPSSHWYLRTGKICAVCGDTNCNDIHVSNEYRTKFCVQVRNLAQVPDDFVMIGSDEISIVGPKHYTLHIDDAGELKVTKGYQGEVGLLFGDLKNRFITRAERQVNGEVWEYVDSVDKGSGEEWELH